MTTTTLAVSSVNPKANIYSHGKCVSHDVLTADGQRKSVGVVFASALTFGTGAPECMECVAGGCEYQLQEGEPWNKVEAGQSFSIAGNSKFNIHVADVFHYICHYG